jgi:hypothetical protein
VIHHVILKADVRDSSRLTRSLMEKGMNAASYFSLNFYDPVNKLLAKYGATKVFLEGDAIIVALLEREGETMLSVGRTCVLAWEIVSLLHEYNGLLERSGLPPMEVGLGIAYQDSPPLYLMDGEHRIMISDAINESDRLSSCNKRVRKKLAPDAGVFQVYSVQIGGGGNHNNDSASDEAGAEEMRLNYNVGGICLSEAAFRKLQQEISISPWQANLSEPGLNEPRFSGPGFTGPWIDEQCEFFTGTVPIANGVFRKIVIRKNRIAQVDVRDLSILHWTGRWYYEVCANPAVYAALQDEQSAPRPSSRAGTPGTPPASSNTPSKTAPNPKRNLHHGFQRHCFSRSFGGREFPAGQGFCRVGIQPVVRAVEDANVAHLPVSVDDRIERNHAVHVGAHQFQRIAGVRFFRGKRRQQFPFFPSSAELRKPHHPTAG